MLHTELKLLLPSWVHGAWARESIGNHEESWYGRLLVICTPPVNETPCVKPEIQSEQLYDPLAKETYVARHEFA
jgi:hypothetical protein